jgi:Penicillin tolerance protein
LSSRADIVLVVGSKNSSNSNRLAELARRSSKNAYLIDYASDIQQEWLVNARTIGVTAGASAPDILVQQVIEHLKGLGCTSLIETDGILENITFEIPKELRIEVKAV